ncbi:TraB/GumN family protein [Andreprevotia chitinilytica]|uniref:TraB/GumN family protein n=1 Tax=Andreprevotia chitinilytica TaxID=396808 RepID=UPI0005517C14|nr:TraB/GumN family protein [Andreprevotia chitinilytica]
MLARFRPLFISLCAVTLLAPATVFAAKAKTVTADAFPPAVLWKVEKPGVKPSYLFGTAHVTDPAVTALSEPVQTVFDNADHIATEIRIDFNMMMTMAKNMLMPEGQNLADLIGAEHYQKLLPELDARGYPETAAKRLKPWAASMQLMVPKHQGGELPLDMLLAKMSIENEKDYVGLETIEEQIAVFADIPQDKQIVLLNSLIDGQDKLEGYYKKLIALYIKRDLDGMMQFADQQEEVDFPKADRAYFDNWSKTTLIGNRNVRMAERMQTLLSQGNSFIAVGAAHLPGKNGLVALLKAQGYTLTPIYDHKK